MTRAAPVLPILLLLAVACGEGRGPAGGSGAGGDAARPRELGVEARHTWLRRPPRVRLSGDAAGARVTAWRVPDPEAFLAESEDPGRIDAGAVPGEGLEVAAKATAGSDGRVALPALPGGLYVVVAERGDLRAAALLPVGNLVLVTKRAAGEVLVYAADADTGAPLPRVRVVVAGPEARAAGTTDALGIYRTALAPGERARVLALREDEVAIATPVFSPAAPDGPVGFVYPDRPAARPGERVSLKAVVRERRGGDLRIPAVEAPARFRVRDGDGAYVTQGEASDGVRGALEGAFTIPGRTRPGRLHIEVDVPGGVLRGDLAVLDPIPPPFTVSVSPDAPIAIAGDEAGFAIQARFSGGVPLAGRRTRYRVERVKGPDEPPRPEIAVTGEGRLDDRGELRTTFPAPAAGTWRIRAEVHDGDGTVIRAAARLDVAAAQFSLQVQPDRRHYPAGGERIPVVTIRPVFAGPRVPVTGELNCGERSWPFSITSEDTACAYVAAPIGEPGLRTFTAVARDERGVEVRGEAAAFVEDGEALAAGPGAGTGIRLLPDRDAYRPGETADVLVTLPAELVGAALLLTVEGARLGPHAVERAEGRSLHLSVPVPDSARGRLRIAVAAVRAGKILRGRAEVEVPAEDRLDVAIAAEPGADGVDAAVEVRDPAGLTVPATVSLALVDRDCPDYDPPPGIPAPPDHDVATDTSLARPFRGHAAAGADAETPPPAAPEDRAGAAPEPPVLVPPDPAPTWFAPRLDPAGDGTARIEGIPVPAAADRFDLLAVGIAKDGRVGVGRAPLVPESPTGVAIAFPRFLVEGDVAHVALRARNGGDEPVEGTLRIGVEGLLPMGPVVAPLSVEAGGRTGYGLDVSARDPGPARIVAELDAPTAARAGRTFTILPHGRRREEARAGPVEPGETSFTVKIPAEATLEGAELTVRVTSGIGAAIEAALPSIERWRPEEADLALLAAVLPIHAEVELRTRMLLPPPEETRESDAPDRIGAVLARQNPDGGWGRFRGDPSDPATTARVHEMLRLAAGLDLLPDPAPAAHARDYLRESLGRPGLSPAATALLLRELALAGEDVSQELPRRADGIVGARSGPVALADLLRARQALGRPGPVADLDLRLREISRRDGEGRVWWGRGERGSPEEDAVAITCAVLAARAELPAGAADELTGRAVGFLLDRRRGAGWGSPRETARACLALLGVLDRDGGGPGKEATLEVRLGDALRGPLGMGREAPRPSGIELDFGPRDLRKGRNFVRIRSRGNLPLRYTALLRFLEPVGTWRPESEGMSVRRTTRRLTQRAGRLVTERLGEPARVRRGDRLAVEITASSETPREDVVVSVPIPAGTRAEGVEGAPHGTRIEIRHDRVRLRLPRLGSEPVRFSVHLRATHRGRFQALPAVAFPADGGEARGSSGEEVLYVVE